MIITLPIPGFVSVVGLAILGLPGDGVQFAPGLPTSLINFAFFLLRELFVGDEFLHGYLVAAPNILIDNRKTPITGGEQMHNGCKFLDDGNYVFTQEEMEEFIKATCNQSCTKCNVRNCFSKLLNFIHQLLFVSFSSHAF